MTLGGTMVTHNCIRYDFCHEQALASLLGVCDEVVVVDGESDDGTWEWLKQVQDRQPKLHLYQRPWGGNEFHPWLDDLCNFAREQLTTPMHLFLCADEVIDQSDFAAIRDDAMTGRSARYHFINFWGAVNTITPGLQVVRLASRAAKCIHNAGELEVRLAPAYNSSVAIYHYSFLRRPKALAAKARKHQMARLGEYDPIYDAVERDGVKALMDPAFETAVHGDRLARFDGKHPAVMHGWLQERGHTL